MSTAYPFIEFSQNRRLRYRQDRGQDPLEDSDVTGMF